MAATPTAVTMVHLKVPGLIIYYDFINETVERQLYDYIMSKPWPVMPTRSGKPLKRRTQHYGFYYSYMSGDIGEKAPPIEGILLDLRNYLSQIFAFDFNQLIINEYERNQGISAHTDSSLYGKYIITLSLMEDCVMTFRKGLETVNLYLPRRSLLLMGGESRYEWTHEISEKVSLTHLPVSDPDDPRYPSRTAPRGPAWKRVSISARYAPPSR